MNFYVYIVSVLCDLRKSERKKWLAQCAKNLLTLFFHAYYWVYILIIYGHHLHEKLLPVLHHGEKSPHFARRRIWRDRYHGYSRDYHRTREKILYAHGAADFRMRKMSWVIWCDCCTASGRKTHGNHWGIKKGRTNAPLWVGSLQSGNRSFLWSRSGVL